MANLPDGLMIGPGSQPEDQDGQLHYMPMPSSMTVFSVPSLPEPEEATGRDAAKVVLQQVLHALEEIGDGAVPTAIDITHLDAGNRAFVDQVLGEGEVSVVAGATHQARNRYWPDCGVSGYRMATGASSPTLSRWAASLRQFSISHLPAPARR